MEYRNLGKSGLQVSLLSFGSWLTFGKQIKDGTAESLMKVAYDGGVNFFDNAEIYSKGESEIVMGGILKKLKWSRDSYIVSSKAFFGSGGQLPTQVGLHRKHLVEACDNALKRLQVEYLDLYFCHRPDKKTPIEETVWTMNNLINQGDSLVDVMRVIHPHPSVTEGIQECLRVLKGKSIYKPTAFPNYIKLWDWNPKE